MLGVRRGEERVVDTVGCMLVVVFLVVIERLLKMAWEDVEEKK